jgi:hypothetical protein
MRVQAAAAVYIRSSLFGVGTQRLLGAIYCRFAVAYRSRLQGSNKMGPIGSPETSVKKLQTYTALQHRRAKNPKGDYFRMQYLLTVF